MRINEITAISTSKALLVPYEAHHVRQYHSWMQDADIQEATASEPMTLDEEYENQQSWRTSTDKLTFIVCAPKGQGHGDESQDGVAATARAEVVDTDDRMRGDINFFLYPYDGLDGEDDTAAAVTAEAEGWCTGEVDVMIASTKHRGQGFGRAAVCALLVYLQKHTDAILGEYAEGRPAVLKDLMVKIKEGNAGSRALFQKLGFVQSGEVNYFGEVVLKVAWEDIVRRDWWQIAEQDYREVEYEKVGEVLNAA
ncbi:acyl-CoA N-acyltransferase [Mariannaea sp. PMI_226]|nr:acyl-CoA N-acyltransferase [Mariannaea sp. PMI_226]